MTNEYTQRFGGIGRLYGEAGLAKFQASHVAIVGIGGVGSWVAESLARSGIGTITLVDLDDICVTNTNRQIHALDHTAIGRPDRVAHSVSRCIASQNHHAVKLRCTFGKRPSTSGGPHAGHEMVWQPAVEYGRSDSFAFKATPQVLYE